MLRSFIRLAIFACLVWMLAGCDIGNQFVTQQTVVASPSLEPTAATETLINNQIVRPSQTVSPSKAATQEMFPTAVPMTNQSVSELFQTNSNCAEPCFWGIVPGQTQLGQVQAWAAANEIELRNPTPNHFDFGYSPAVGLGASVLLEVEEDVITGLEAEILGFEDPTILKSSYLAFSPEAILQAFGEPSQIGINTEGPHEPNAPQDKVLFDFTFFYDEINFTIYFSGGPIDRSINNTYELCPGKDKLTYIRLWLGDYRKGMPNRGYITTLDEITTITTDEFTKQLSESPDNFCFSLDPSRYMD